MIQHKCLLCFYSSFLSPQGASQFRIWRQIYKEYDQDSCLIWLFCGTLQLLNKEIAENGCDVMSQAQLWHHSGSILESQILSGKPVHVHTCLSGTEVGGCFDGSHCLYARICSVTQDICFYPTIQLAPTVDEKSQKMTADKVNECV